MNAVAVEVRDLVVRFGARAGQERGIGRIERAGEHEVLPHEQAEFIAQVVEVLALVDAAAPYPQHVHVRRGRAAQVAGVIGPG